MTPREFFYLVASMRAAQISYYASRRNHESPDDQQRKLRACKALEGDVDNEIYRVKQIIDSNEKVQVGNQNDQRQDIGG